MNAAASDTRLISGTFLQLDHWDDREGERFQRELRSLTPDHWRQMLHDMAAIGIDTLVFQQAADARGGLDDVRVYYPGSSLPVPEWMKGKPDLYTEVVDEADRLGMKIFHAVYGMHLPNPAERLDEAIGWGRRLLAELLERYGGRPSFAGWYWTYEYRRALADRSQLRPGDERHPPAGYRRRHHRLSGHGRPWRGTGYFRAVCARRPVSQPGAAAVCLRGAELCS